MLIEILGREAREQHMEYMCNTNKPDGLSVSKWIQQLKNMNNVLAQTDSSDERQKYTEKQLITYCISPNLPEICRTLYRIQRCQYATHLADIRDILDELEVADKLHRSNNKGRSKERERFKSCNNNNHTNAQNN